MGGWYASLTLFITGPHPVTRFFCNDCSSPRLSTYDIPPFLFWLHNCQVRGAFLTVATVLYYLILLETFKLLKYRFQSVNQEIFLEKNHHILMNGNTILIWTLKTAELLIKGRFFYYYYYSFQVNKEFVPTTWLFVFYLKYI